MPRVLTLTLQVWDRLGVRLEVSEHERVDEVTFSIQHPDLSSGMIAPKAALTAELQLVSVSVHISNRRAVEAPCKKRRVAGSRTGPQVERSSKRRDTTGLLSEHTCPALGSEDYRAIDDFLLNLDDQQRSVDTTIHPEPKLTEDQVFSHSSLPLLVHSSLAVLLQGTKKRHVGIKWTDGKTWSGLLQLAPAVLYIPYLQVRRLDPSRVCSVRTNSS